MAGIGDSAHPAQELETLEGFAVEKRNLTSVPEDLGLEHGHRKNVLSLNNSEFKHFCKVSSKNV